MSSIKDPVNQYPKVDARPISERRDPKMLEAAKGFEGQFLRQLVGEMRKTVPKDELIGESMADSIYRDQLDNEYVDTWVNQGGIGLTDLIYDQLNEKYGTKPTPQPRAAGLIPLSPQTKAPLPRGESITNVSKSGGSIKPDAVGDIFDKKTAELFLARREPQGLVLKSRDMLHEKVQIRAPFSGTVMQASALEDGRQAVILKHDKGLVSQIVFNGYNHVNMGARVETGDILGEILPTKKGRLAKVFFGLRKASIAE